MAKSVSPLAALPCKISRSALPDERAFTITTTDGGFHVGSGTTHYFWDASNHPLTLNKPGDDGEIDGLVAAQVLRVDGNRALAEVPDANVIWINMASIVTRPTEVRFDVLV